MDLVTAANSSPPIAQRVLIIDNEPMIMRMLDHMLRNVCDVTVAGGVEDAIAALEARTYDAVISDLELGDADRDGLWMLERARARMSPLRRVLITGHPFTESMLPPDKHSIRLLLKPFTYNQLLASIRIEPQ